MFAIFDSPGCFLLLKGFHEKYFLRKQALFIKTAPVFCRKTKRLEYTVILNSTEMRRKSGFSNVKRAQQTEKMNEIGFRSKQLTEDGYA